MTSIHHDPLSGVETVLVDATNLLHALARGAQRVPATTLIGRMRAAIPAPARIVLVFDGPPEPGVRGERIAGGLTVRYSGRYSADSVIVTLVEEASQSARPGTAAGDDVLVVTDDRDLRHQVGRHGGRTAGTSWLLGRLDRARPVGAGIANRRPPRPPAAAATKRPPKARQGRSGR